MAIQEAAVEGSESKSATMPDLARLWACRLLVKGRGYRALDERRCRMGEEMCEFVGLDPARAAADRRYTREQLRKSLNRFDGRVQCWPTLLARRLDELGEQLSLDTVERELLALMTLLTIASELREAAQITAQAEKLDHVGLAACALQRSPVEIEPALLPTARLARSGLLRLNAERGRRHMYLSDEIGFPGFELLGGLAATLTSRTGSVSHFLASYFQRVSLEEHSDLDFDHLAEESRRLGALVEHALQQEDVGLNILIHGRPGVGKTEFVRHLAAQHGWSLYNVSSSDTEQEFLAGQRRFRAYLLCQFLLEHQPRGVLMFDEIEDVFDSRFVGLPDRTGPLGEKGAAGKAWTNRVLESNVRPVIWICNAPDMLDPAYVRRFDYILRMDLPPRHVRRAMLEQAFEDITVPTRWLDERAGDTDMSPARIAQIGRLARRLEPAIPFVELPSVLDEQLAQQRATLGRNVTSGRRRSDPLGAFDLALMNTRPSADSLLNGLERRSTGTVLLHGPPGTGKTTFAEHVAERLGRELVTRSASELLDKYLGGTEKLLAQMFEEADNSDAVLLLDEADNFLTTREGARNQWQLTQTNEMLVQMERFNGIFLCATNLLDTLDSASIRRFDVKIEFEYLTEQQRWQLFTRLLESHGLMRPHGGKAQRLRASLNRLDRLTPGDFAAIVRGNQLLADESVDANILIERLESEQEIKAGPDLVWRGFV